MRRPPRTSSNHPHRQQGATLFLSKNLSLDGGAAESSNRHHAAVNHSLPGWLNKKNREKEGDGAGRGAASIIIATKL